MSIPVANRVRCEQCGAALAPNKTQCLNCLLVGGLTDAELRDSTAPMNENGPETLSESRFYQHYEVETRADGALHELGRGAMGVTYKALDVNLRVPVALKVINARYSSHPEARARFLREARAAARLRHPNVASVFHYGTLNRASAEEGAEECFYAMEFVEGETLEARVRRDGKLSIPAALRMATQVTRALTAAEKRGLIHRDLKPSNIMLAADEGESSDTWVKVIDFGLAKALADDGAEVNGETLLTQGGFHGTPQFASPEQIDNAEMDVRSDIYSLGVTLWFALTGELPFEGRSLAEVRDRQLNRPLPEEQLKEAGVPPGLIALLRSMLSADPEQRPASATALHGALLSCATASPGRARMFAVFGAAALVAAAVVGFFVARSHPVPQAPARSVAVLPFENLSKETENEFFAEGIQDDVLTSLGKFKELVVISRSSVLPYTSDKPRNVREIGQQLGVSHLLEGSVRRAGDRVLVNVQLIEAGTQRQIWAERYDRTLYDALTLQGELATEIATAMHATFDPEERTRIRTKPTNNPQAYVLYLRARSLELRPTYVLQDFQTAQTLYEQAIALDPEFALAHARLSSTLAYIYRNSVPTEDLKTAAHAEADAALRIQPELGEAHLARALCFYRIDRDYDAARQELAVAERLLPNDANVEITTAFIDRRQGQWREAVARIERASTRDPRNAQVAQELYNTHRMLREWPAAARAADRAIAFAPELVLLRLERGYLDFWWKGQLRPLQTALATAPSNVDPDGNVTWMRWDASMLARDFAAAELIASRYDFDTLPSVLGTPMPKSFMQGCAVLAQGEAERAKAFFESARLAMENDVAKTPSSAMRHARLGQLFALMGRKEDAIREGQRATELQPESTDAFGGPTYASMLALIYARTGENDRALALIERLLTTPGPVHYHGAGMTIADLRSRWQWDPIRSDPRFQRIVEGPEPQTLR
jgi:serine/threonine protein kinase/tetratricopeptide (TPR) repeat protein